MSTFAQTEALADALVLAAARKALAIGPVKYGYGDVGDTLVRYLQGKTSVGPTLEDIRLYALDYQRNADQANGVVKQAGQAIEQAHPFGYRSGDNEP